jgi:hypothetical protein
MSIEEKFNPVDNSVKRWSYEAIQLKGKRIDYLHQQKRISDEEYEKWIMSEDPNFEPKVISKEEAEANFKRLWSLAMDDSPLQFVPDYGKQTVELLEELVKQIKKSNDLLEEIRRNG